VKNPVNQPNWSKLMKITVIKKATTDRKPQNFCPWVQDEITERKK